MKRHFQTCAAYNRWANARIYEAALTLDEADYRRDVGAFFKSLHGTLNHLLVGDRVWLRRFTGEGEQPPALDAILYKDRAALTAARAREDARIATYVDGLDATALAADLVYTTMAGEPFRQPLADALVHFFNHQTHHRGQAHTVLSILTGAEPPSLDLLGMQRGLPAPDLAALAARGAV